MAFTDQIKTAPPNKLFIVGLGLASLIFFMGGQKITTLRGQISVAKADLEKKKKTLQDTEERAADKQRFQEEIDRISQTVALALNYLPKEMDTQNLLKIIYSESRTAGVELSNFVPHDAVSQTFYDELPIDIQVRGTYSQIVHFLVNISKVPRIINIKDVDLGDAKMVDGYPVLTLRGKLVGYRYKEGKS